MNLSLLTDLYELTMMQGYFLTNPEERGVFEMFFRRQPFGGGYAVSAGLGPLLDALASFRFAGDDIDYLASLGLFRRGFLDFLAGFSFRGDVHAVTEGTPVFPYEPIVRVSGSLMEAQAVESLVLNIVNFQSLIATKSSRVAGAAGGRPVLEFGLRRAQGADGAIAASRAAHIGGAAATSNTLAGKIFGIPVSGTMAHSWVMSFHNELEAFEKYAAAYPERCVLLVDTYDTLKSGVPNAIALFRRLKERNPSLMAVRIDSGDLGRLAAAVRRMLDDAGLAEVKIYASSDLDEWTVRGLVSSGAPIDAFGVGTRLVTGWDDPALTGVYKIAAGSGKGGLVPRVKISDQPDKATTPGVKNVMRFYDDRGMMMADLIILEDEDEMRMAIESRRPVRFNPTRGEGAFILDSYESARELLAPVMKDGKTMGVPEPLSLIRTRLDADLASLGDEYRRLEEPAAYRVCLSDRLTRLAIDMSGRR